MKKVFLILTAILFLNCCGLLKKTPVNDGMKATFSIYNSRQVDSVCVADTLLQPIERWMKSSYNDYETGKTTVKYVYFKVIGEDRELIYIVEPKDTMFVLTKRFVE